MINPVLRAGFLGGIAYDELGDPYYVDDEMSNTDGVELSHGLGDIVTLPDGTRVNTADGSVILGNGEQFDSSGQIVTLPDGTIVNKIAGTVTTTDGVEYKGANQIKLPFGITQTQVDAFTAKLGQQAGNWIAKQVGGSTVFYRQNGGIGQLDIKSLLVPGAILAAIFLS